MELTLYSIPGISKIDTPFFSTSTNQTSYFASKIIGTTSIADFYYPPYYENSIKVSASDYSTRSSANYLSFIFNNKTFYYFINYIEYLNESVWILHIEMDVIQTFMFQIYYNSLICERKHIKRWNSVAGIYYINRNYIRENVSNNVMIPRDKSFIYRFTNASTSKLVDLWYGIKINSASHNQNTYPIKNIITRFGSNIKYVDAHSYVFLPVVLPEVVRVLDSSQQVIETYTDDAILDVIQNYVDSTNVDEIIIYRGKPFSDAYGTYYLSNGKIYLDIKSGMCEVVRGNDGTQDVIAPVITGKLTFVNLNPFTNLGRYTETSMELTSPKFVNVSLPVNFKPHFVLEAKAPDYEPCLLDDNYMQLVYGDGSSQGCFPVFSSEVDYNSSDSSISYKLSIGYLQGLEDGTATILVSTTSSGSQAITDKYDSLLVLTNVTNMDIMSSPWKEYVAANKNRFISAGLKTALNTAESIISIASSMYLAKVGVDQVRGMRKSYTPKRGNLSAKASRTIENIQSRAVTDITSKATSALSDTLPTISQLITDSNVQAMPYKTSCTGNLSNICNYTLNIYYQWKVVQNFNECFLFYTMYGNKVNELWSCTGSSNMLITEITAQRTRYYFNYFKFSNINIRLQSFNSVDILEKIEDRLMLGIRFWNVANKDLIGYYSHDNVETDFLS